MTRENLPAIHQASPLAEGLTVNLRMAGNRYQLRIWAQGAAVEDSLYDTPTEAVERLGRIVLERVGGADAVLGRFVRGLFGGAR
jgi:hypothetical protein